MGQGIYPSGYCSCNHSSLLASDLKPIKQSPEKKSSSKNIDLVILLFDHNFQKRLVILNVMIIFEGWDTMGEE